MLLHAYAEPPYRVGRALPDGDGLHVILASTGPGVFGGDALTQDIVVEGGAIVRLTSQSAMQIHASNPTRPAKLTANYRIETEGQLTCEWDPLIPFADADFDHRIAIDVADGGALLWSDAFMAGREARGERWKFDRIFNELQFCRTGRLVYLERYTIIPAVSAPTQRWIAHDGCYFGTVLGVGPLLNRARVDEMHQALAGRQSLRVSADLLDEQLLLLKLVASDGPSFHQARAVVARSQVVI